jgi:ABC-type multidrug transport system permease subunit
MGGSEMKKQQREKWEKVRARGKKRFVFFNGIIGWGLPTAFLYTSAMTYMDQGALEFNDAFYRLLLIAIVLFPIGGVVFGLWVWNWSERAYHKASGE